jgi:RNA polymerase sigma-70 factor (ECF subfamily)
MSPEKGESVGRPPDESRQRFEEIYEAHYAAIARYALRRTSSADDAVDVVSETFLTAWRRLGDVPDGDRTRLWLYAVARRVLANVHRGSARRERLAERLRTSFTEVAADRPDEREEVRAAFAGLSAADRELLSLTAWEGLSPTEIATVLGCTRGTVRVRLHRARRRLARRLAAAGVDLERYGVRVIELTEGVNR